jgi:hypothetical protein
MPGLTETPKVMTRAQIDDYLKALEDRLPALRQDMNSFYREFEDWSDKLVASIDAADIPYAYRELELIIARSGVNA